MVNFLVAPGEAGAQSIVRGELQGLVAEAEGEALPFAAVTLRGVGGAEVAYEEADRLGRFSFPLLASGEYQLLVEAPGFIPRLITGVRVPTGQSVRVNAELRAAPPPVESIDTVAAGAAARPRHDGLASRWITRSEIRRLSDPRLSLAALANLGVGMDEALGSEGLPGDRSVLLLDGVPFMTAQHPEQRGVGDLPLIPRIGMASLDVHRRTDIEWSGASGAYVAAISRRGAVGDAGGELRGSAAAGTMRQTEDFGDFDAPDEPSFWGGGAARLGLGDSGASLFVGAEGAYDRTPYASSVGDIASGLAGAIPGDAPGASQLSEPWTNEFRAISGLAHLDWSGEATDVGGTATFATLRDTGTEHFARPLDYGLTGPFEGSDVGISGSLLTRLNPELMIEGRMSLQSSSREWGGLESPGESSLFPSTRFIGEGALFGPEPGLAASVNRNTFVAMGAAHFEYQTQRVKVGAQGILSSHEYDYLHGSRGSFLFAAPEEASAGQGYFTHSGVGGAEEVPTSSFSMRQIGVFIQHQWDAAPGLRLTSGVRFDLETLPSDGVANDRRWADLTGINNDDFVDQIQKFSPRIALEWEPSPGGGTAITAAGGLHYGELDPAAFAEVVSTAQNVRARRQLGGLGTWPDLPAQSGSGVWERRVLTLFGPELRAPRTIRGTAGLTQRIGERAVVGVSGTFRRSEFLLRRDDLNLSVVPSAAMVQGRPLWGDLSKSGSLVVAEPGSNRQFDDRDVVWSLNSSGWSEYTGLTFSFEYAATDRLDIFGNYTFSSTEDNLIGYRSGIPEAQLSPHLSSEGESGWEEGTSDFDIPHRIDAGVLTRLPVLEGIEASGVYRFRSGLPFTPGYRPGVDINGDGSGFNDPAFVPESVLGSGGLDLSCLSTDVGGIATRNACRTDGVHQLDLHLAVGLLRIGDSLASLTLDAFNVTNAETGRPDAALLLVDPEAPLIGDTDSDQLTVPISPNPDFGQIQTTFRSGTLVRIGFHVELP